MTRRLCVFAQTGADGSMGALWRAADATVKRVHLGSGSGSLLTCVLADTAVDFLRLLAIGYDEICWREEFASSPLAIPGFRVEPKRELQERVKTTFRVEIPATALEIVRHPADIGDEHSADAFVNWCNRLTA